MSKPLLMVPGPTEFDEDVLYALGEPTDSHVAPDFIEQFGRVIEQTRNVFLAPDGQPLIVSASGSLGWDIIAANLVEPGHTTLIINTGFFSDRFAECLMAYGVSCDHVRAAAIGTQPTLEAIEEALKRKAYQLITITHVDTSTSVLADVKGMCELVRAVSPDTLIAVDGVCSIAGEELHMKDWDVDVAMTCSQKALGVPPGLMVMVLRPRAVDAFRRRKVPIAAYYASLAHWLPVMEAYEKRTAAYFATPAVNLINALHVGLTKVLNGGMDARFAKHQQVGRRFNATLKAWGLKLVALTEKDEANTLSAIRYPQGVTGTALLPALKKHGVIAAGGLHPEIKADYFRIGHMGVSTMDDSRGHIEKTLKAIHSALSDCGYAFP